MHTAVAWGAEGTARHGRTAWHTGVIGVNYSHSLFLADASLLYHGSFKDVLHCTHELLLRISMVDKAFSIVTKLQSEEYELGWRGGVVGSGPGRVGPHWAWA